jgi:hypothetical protein
MKTKQSKPQKAKPGQNYPPILGRYVREVGGTNGEGSPRRITKKFHGLEISGWSGRIHVEDIRGWVENKRLKLYLSQWRDRRGKPNAVPTTDEMYELMLEADRGDDGEKQKVFHVERLASSIARNGIQEPIIIFLDEEGTPWLWDGNRRYFSTLHIMRDGEFEKDRDEAQWIPCFLIETTGSPALDRKFRQAILTETNFVTKDAISWPTYIKAEEIWEQFNIRTKADPTDPLLQREVREELAREYGLFTSKGKPAFRQVDRWVKMVNLAREFKEYQEDTNGREETAVDLHAARYFEYFDELNKKAVREVLATDPDKESEVFDWLWDEKLPSFQAVRKIPQIFGDPVALEYMRSGTKETAFENAAKAIAANDPSLVKDKRAADAKIKSFGDWLNSFKREDFRQLEVESLQRLKEILEDVIKMLTGLISGVSKKRKTRKGHAGRRS